MSRKPSCTWSRASEAPADGGPLGCVPVGWRDLAAAGPVRSLAEPVDETVSQSILRRVAVSRKHGSKVVAVVAHDDCAGNPEDETTQRRQLEEAVGFIAGHFPEVLVLGLWLSRDWSVFEVTSRDPTGGA